jgi:hypothetical protein
MKLPNWFKIAWWCVLLIITGTILFKRLNAIWIGESEPFDIIILLIFIALLLIPIFSEISLFGLKLKKDIEDFRKETSEKFGEIKTEIKNTQSQTLNATFHGYGPPPSDNKLQELDNKMGKIIQPNLYEGDPFANNVEDDVPNEKIDMFKIRYNIEKQLKRIWYSRFGKASSFGLKIQYQPIQGILQDLLEYELIDIDFYAIVKDILAICNNAVHGNELTEKQNSFVIRNYRQVLKYLLKI